MLNIDELPTQILIENSHFDICVIRADDFFGSSLTNDIDTIIDKNLFFSDNVTGVILYIEGYCISILKERNRQMIYAFDSHSRDSEGNIDVDGSSILMKFLSIKNFWEYIVSTYGSKSCQLVYIKAVLQENKVDLEKSLVKFKRSKLHCDHSKKNTVDLKKENFRKHYEKNSTEIKNIRKRRYENNTEQEKENRIKRYRNNLDWEKQDSNNRYKKNSTKIKDNIKKSYEINSTKIKDNKKKHYINNSTKIKDNKKKQYLSNSNKIKDERKKHYSKNSTKLKKNRKIYCKKVNDTTSNSEANSVRRIERFKNRINEGPFFICICCNRCLYNRSVLLFN